MMINRRMFFSVLFARPLQSMPLRVAVLETFNTGTTSAAVLVHHAEAAARDAFAQWLQAHPNAAIRIRRETGEEAPATIFRVRMCFGRGLILMQKAIRIQERDVLTVLADERH